MGFPRAQVRRVRMNPILHPIKLVDMVIDRDASADHSARRQSGSALRVTIPTKTALERP